MLWAVTQGHRHTHAHAEKTSRTLGTTHSPPDTHTSGTKAHSGWGWSGPQKQYMMGLNWLIGWGGQQLVRWVSTELTQFSANTSALSSSGKISEWTDPTYDTPRLDPNVSSHPEEDVHPTQLIRRAARHGHVVPGTTIFKHSHNRAYGRKKESPQTCPPSGHPTRFMANRHTAENNATSSLEALTPTSTFRVMPCTLLEIRELAHLTDETLCGITSISTPFGAGIHYAQQTQERVAKLGLMVPGPTIFKHLPNAEYGNKKERWTTCPTLKHCAPLMANRHAADGSAANLTLEAPTPPTMLPYLLPEVNEMALAARSCGHALRLNVNTQYTYTTPAADAKVQPSQVAGHEPMAHGTAKHSPDSAVGCKTETSRPKQAQSYWILHAGAQGCLTEVNASLALETTALKWSLTCDRSIDAHSDGLQTSHEQGGSWWFPTVVGVSLSWGWYKWCCKQLSDQPELHTKTYQHEIMIFFPDDKLSPLVMQSPTPFLSAKHVMMRVEEHTGLSLRTHHPRIPGSRAKLATWCAPGPTELAVHRSHQYLRGGGESLDELWLAVEWLAIKRRWAEDGKQRKKAVGKLSKLCWITLSNAIKEYHERITGEEHTPEGVFSLANFDEIFGRPAEKGSWREVLFNGIAHGTDARKQQDILLSLAPLPLQDYPLMADFLLFLCENNRRANRPNLIHLYSSKALPSTAGIANLTLETVTEIIEGVVVDNTPSQRLKILWKGSFNPPSVQQTKMLLVRCLMVESMQQKALEGLEQPRSPLAAATRTASPLLEPQPTTHQSQPRDPAPFHPLGYKKRIVREYLTRSSLPPSPRESPPVEHVEDSVEAEGMASRSPSPDIRTQGTKRARDGTPMPTVLHADRDETPCEDANAEE